MYAGHGRNFARGIGFVRDEDRQYEVVHVEPCLAYERA
jgi:hypothetical protein